MNFIKRAFLSVTKNMKRTALLFIILLVVGNLVLSGLAINNAAKKSMDVARQTLGGTVTLRVDQRQIMEARRNGEDLEIPQITTDMADELSKSEYVVGYNYSSNVFVTADDFDYVQSESSESTDETMQFRIKGLGSNPEYDQPEISLAGVLGTDLTSDFIDGNSKIVEGRGITKEDTNNDVVVVEKNLASENDLKVGDKITVQSIDQNSKKEFEIVGIYKTENVSTNSSNIMPAMSPYNTIYASYNKTYDLQPEDQSEQNTSNSIEEVVYYLDDPLHIENFKNDAQKSDIDFDKYTLDANDMAYKQMVGPMESVSSIAKQVVYLVSIGGGVILALIIILTMRERMYELGVLLSLGEKKFLLIGQLLIETLIIGVLAFGISTFTGKTIAEKVGNEMLEKQITASQEESNMPNKFMIRGSGGSNRLGKDVDPIDQIDISITNDELQKVSQIGLCVIILSILAPSVYILRLSPKTILSSYE